MMVSLLVPPILIWISFELYEGPGIVHGLHLLNVASLLMLGYLVVMVPAFP